MSKLLLTTHAVRCSELCQILHPCTVIASVNVSKPKQSFFLLFDKNGLLLKAKAFRAMTLALLSPPSKSSPVNGEDLYGYIFTGLFAALRVTVAFISPPQKPWT